MSEFKATVATISDHFKMNFVRRGEVGAALSIWMGRFEVCRLQEGFVDYERSAPFEEDTMVTVNSAINGPIAAATLIALHAAGLTVDSLIGEIWPELAGGRLAKYSLGLLLSHQCGIPVLDHPADGNDHESMVAALNAQIPLWTPGEKHGYHVGTFPVIAEELVRRAVKIPLPQYWRSELGEIMELDIWIGSDYPGETRISEALQVRGPVDINSKAAFAAFADRDSLCYRAYRLSNEGAGNGNAPHPDFPLPRVSGIASANSLARFYALFAGGGQWEGFQLVPEEVCHWAGQLLVQGHDQVLQTKTAFSAGFMKDPVALHKETIHLFNSSPHAFGHPGEGGTFAFGDPGTQVGFAYVANQMDRSLLPAEKALCLSRPFYEF